MRAPAARVAASDSSGAEAGPGSPSEAQYLLAPPRAGRAPGAPADEVSASARPASGVILHAPAAYVVPSDSSGTEAGPEPRVERVPAGQYFLAPGPAGRAPSAPAEDMRAAGPAGGAWTETSSTPAGAEAEWRPRVVGIEESLPEGSLLRPAVAERNVEEILRLAEEGARDVQVARDMLVGLEAVINEGVLRQNEGTACEFLAHCGVPRLLAVVHRHMNEDAEMAEGFCRILDLLGRCESELVTRELKGAPVAMTLYECLEKHAISKEVVGSGLDAMFCLVERGEDLETAFRTKKGMYCLRRAMARAVGGFGKEVDVALSALEIIAVFALSNVSELLKDGTVASALKCCKAFACCVVDEVTLRIVTMVADTEEGRRHLLGMNQDRANCETLNTLAAVVYRSVHEPLTARRVCAVVRSVSCVVDTAPEVSLAASAAIANSEITTAIIFALRAATDISERRTAIALASDALDATS